MELQNFIFHELITQAGNKKVSVLQKDEEHKLPDENADNLVIRAIRSFNKDRGRAYARFGGGWLPKSLALLMASERDFLSFSLTGLEDLQTQLRHRVATTGGHLFFIRYQDEGNPFFMVLLLKDLEGFIISNQELESSHILNLEKLHFAAMVDINRWHDSEDDGAYITFLKGSSRKDISDYFKEFLCIDEATFIDPKKNTLALVDAINDYCSSHFDEYDIKNSRSNVKQEITRCIGNGDDITLEGISKVIDPKHPERFSDFLVKKGYEIQPEFGADARYLKKLTTFSGKAKGIRISFDYDLLNSEVKFEDSTTDTTPPKLIISKIPPDLLIELRQAERTDNED